MSVIIHDDLPGAVTLEQMKAATAIDPQVQLLTTAVQHGYVLHSSEKVMLKSYTNIFSELSVAQRLILRGSKLVVPVELRAQVITLVQHTKMSSSSNTPNTWASRIQRKYHTPLGQMARPKTL